MPGKGSFPPQGAVLLVPLTDAQFESALEVRELRVPGYFVPEGALPSFLGVMRARHAGMLTHWAQIRSADREEAGEKMVHLRLGPLNRLPRPIEWKEQREVYKPISVEAGRLPGARAIEDLVDAGREVAQLALLHAAQFIEFEAPALDLGRVGRSRLLERAAGFAARDPARALKQIDDAVTEALRDVAAALYGDPREEDQTRDGWFGEEKFVPSVEAYFELLREAEDPQLAALLAAVEKYLARRDHAKAAGAAMQQAQMVDLIATAQGVLEAASGSAG